MLVRHWRDITMYVLPFASETSFTEFNTKPKTIQRLKICGEWERFLQRFDDTSTSTESIILVLPYVTIHILTPRESTCPEVIPIKPRYSTHIEVISINKLSQESILTTFYSLPPSTAPESIIILIVVFQ